MDAPDPFVELFVIARKTRRRLTDNFVLAFLVSVICIPLAAAGVVTSVVAGLVVTVGTVLVLANSVHSLIE